MAEIHDALKRYFGYDDFLDGQEEIITRLIEGEELCVVMPTGAGKSLGYQLPAIIKPGYTLVISPLISLMKDQVDTLVAKGIPAAYINSTLNPAERRQTMARWQAGAIKLLYVAPERLRTRDFRAAVRRRPPAFLAIDEAHCVSQWGHDFRPDYARIGEFIDDVEIPQVCAFTATATELVRGDIMTQLHRPEMTPFVTGFTRPNLIFQVHRTNRAEDKLRVMGDLLDRQVPTIIYASTRKNVELLADALGCLAYHGGLSDEVRSQVQDDFMQLPQPVIAATNAFGMGIDRPDLRQVIHYNIPSSLEAYYQEAGRAGRDGEDAHCHLLFSQQDRFVHEFLIDLNYPPEFVLHETWQVLVSLAQQDDTVHLELTQTELASQVYGAKGDQQISAALKMLERHGFIERGYRQANRGNLRMNGSADELLKTFPKPNSQRALFVHKTLEVFGDDIELGVDCNYAELEHITGLRPEQLRRVLRAMQGKGYAWTPPFAGRGITILRPDDFTLDIDYSAQMKRKDLETKRLDLIFAYPTCRDCRQLYLVNYFGQQIEGWTCQVCDLCQSRARRESHVPTAAETAIVQAALEGAATLSGHFGKNRIAQFLTGSRSKGVMDAGLQNRPHYGALGKLDQASVNSLLEALLEAGCLQVTGDPHYPRLDISDLGHDVLAGKTTVPMRLDDILSQQAPASKRTSSRSAKATDDTTYENDDLFERLRTIRTEMATKQNVPAYHILANAPLRKLAAMAPVTAEEAQTIKGIGPVKAMRVIPYFLDEISAWRAENK